MRGTKYIISQHTSFTEAVTIVKKHSIYALIIFVHYRFINLALNLVVLTLIDTRN